MARGHRSAWFPLLSACRFVEFDTSIICHVLVYCFLLISIARYIFKSPRICFWGTKYDVYRERVVYLHYILWRRARLWLELFASTADKFFSRVSYLPSHVFLRRRRRFTSRKLYACLEKFLCFLHKVLSPLIVLEPQDLNLTLNAQVCWLCCVLYMSLFGLVQARPWFRSSIWISSVAGISKILCTSEVASATRT